MARVFSAVSIEDPEIIDNLVDIRDRMNLGLRPVDKEKLHITFQFFHDIDQKDIAELKQQMDQISMAPFELEIKGIGAFPSEDYIRVIWAGAESEKMQQLNNVISNHDVEDDNGNSFKPHVTLLRVEDLSIDRKRKLQRTMREFQDHSFGSIKVDSVKLYESVLNSKGTVYKELYEKEL